MVLTIPELSLCSMIIILISQFFVNGIVIMIVVVAIMILIFLIRIIIFVVFVVFHTLCSLVVVWMIP